MGLLEIVYRFYTPPLCLFGAIGNCLSVYVFCMTSGHRNLSSSYYLSALAISDIGFLVNLFAMWLTEEGYSVVTTPLTCPLIMYLGQVTCFLSVWFIVAFTTERFCAVCYPLTRPTVCTVARAKKVIGFLTLTALLLFSYVLVIASVVPIEVELEEVISTGWSRSDDGNIPENENQTSGANSNGSYFRLLCSVPVEFHDFSMMANHVDSFFTLILPFIAITFLNVRITLCVWKFKGQRETIVAPSTLNRANSVSSNDRTRIVTGPAPRHAPPPTQNGNSHFSPPICHSHSHKARRQLPGTTFDGRKKSQGSSPPGGAGGSSKCVPASAAAEVRVTKTLLLVSTVFLVLNVPSHVIRAFAFVQRGLFGASEDPSYVLHFQQWANILFNTNFSVNFLLYCVSGRNFRKSLRSLCWRDEGPRGHKGQRMSPKGLKGPSKKSHHDHRTQMELSEVRLEPGGGAQCGKHSKSVHYLAARPTSREMSFYPSSQTEVETYYA